jgi:uncharacterized protein with NRDE domain
MCLIFLSIHNHPNYKLIVAANRDEFYNRKTAAAEFWPTHPYVVGGRDLEAMKEDGTCGTWLAMSKTGKIALLTNYRDPKNINPQAPSRGYLVTDYLLSNTPSKKYLEDILPSAKEYNGFNLVVGDADELFYLSNNKEGIEKISDGLHGLSNHLLDTPWPKVERGKNKMASLFEKDRIDPNKALNALYDEERAADKQLPETGIGLERERALSSMFIKTDNYGSRCSTVILIDKNNKVDFTERVYNLQTFEYTSSNFEFSIHP